MTTRDVLAAFGRIPPRKLELAIRVICLVLLIGLAVKNVFMAYWGMVASLVVLALILLVNTLAPLMGRRQPVPSSLLMVALVATILVSTWYLGASGAIWMFPAIVALRYTGPEIYTGPLRLALVVLVPVLVAGQGDLPNAGRLFAASAISAMYLWLAEGQVISLQSRLDRDAGRDPLTRAYTAARLEQDVALIPKLAPVGMIVLQIDGVAQMRNRAQAGEADAILSAVAKEIRPLLSARERLYRLGENEFLVGLAGWRAYESYELGQQLCRAVEGHLPEGRDLRIGVAEVYESADFPAALETAYTQLDRLDRQRSTG